MLNLPKLRLAMTKLQFIKIEAVEIALKIIEEYLEYLFSGPY